MEIIKEGHSSYGNCWIEDHGSYYIVCTMNGKSKEGPFSSFKDAMAYFKKFCPQAE